MQTGRFVAAISLTADVAGKLTVPRDLNILLGTVPVP